MGKDKLRKFRENLTFDCFIQPEFDEVFRCDHPLKGHWRSDFFHNDNPIVLELGCGKGEYTVALAERDPSRNFIGIDIKGARMWRGAKTATDRRMPNVGFLRTRIEFINGLFAEGEVDEIWITFPDPQLKSRRAKKRLTSPLFLGYYARILSPGGWINLKTCLLYTSVQSRPAPQAVPETKAGEPRPARALSDTGRREPILPPRTLSILQATPFRGSVSSPRKRPKTLSEYTQTRFRHRTPKISPTQSTQGQRNKCRQTS